MKKVLKILGIVVLLILVILIVAPFFLKGKIIEVVKSEANKNLKAEVEFADVNLSFFRSFPDLFVGVEKLSVVGVDEFQGDTLARMKSLNLSVNVMSAISGDQIEINEIALQEPLVNIIVHEDGAANYDIAKESAQEEESEDEVDDEGGSTSLSIESYSIDKGTVIYSDQSLKMLMVLLELNHSGSGNFAEEVFTLSTQTEIGDVYFDYEGTTYIQKTRANLKADIGIDLANMKFTFQENELAINNLLLAFDGWLAMPDEDIDMDITYSSTNNDLAGLLSLVPSEYTSDMDGVDASAQIGFSGYVKGVYNDNSMPGFGVDLKVEQGNIQYPDLPKSIQNMQVDAHIKSPEGNDMDAMTINIPKFYMELGSAGNNVDARLSLKNPMTDPLIDTRVDSDLDLGSFMDAIPVKGIDELAGDLAAHFGLKGALSDIENQRFDKFMAEGAVNLNNFVYADSLYNVSIPEAATTISPQKLDISTFKMVFDEMNIEANGYADNYVNYILSDTTLHGKFNLSIDKIDVDKYMSAYSSEEGTTEAESDLDAAEPDTTDEPGSEDPILVPANLNVELNAKVGEISYDGLILSNVNGLLKIKDEQARIENLSCEALDGTISMSGLYNTQIHSTPAAEFSYDINNIGIREAATTINMVEKYAPIAKHATGKVSSTFSLKTDLHPSLEPVYESMNGSGRLRTSGVVLEGGKFLEKLSKTLKSPALARQEVQDVNATFSIKDGKITTDPFDIKINDMTANVSGYTTVEQKMDYLMKMKVPRESLGGEFNKMAEGLLSQANAFLGGSMSLGETINVDVRIHGDVTDPKISPQFAGTEGGSAKEVVKEKIEEEIDKAKEDAIEEAQKQADKLLADAQKQADRIVREADKAAQKLREEAESQAQKLIDEANNPFTKQGAKIAGDALKKEANKKAKQLEDEAQKQADNVMSRARKEADDLIEKAKSK